MAKKAQKSKAKGRKQPASRGPGEVLTGLWGSVPGLHRPGAVKQSRPSGARPAMALLAAGAATLFGRRLLKHR